MEHYLDGYAQFLQNTSKSKHTIKQYVLDAKHFLSFWSAHTTERPFQQVLVDYRAHLQDKYATASVNRKLAGTRKFVLFLYDRQYIAHFTDTVFEPIEKVEQQLNYLTQNQIKLIQSKLQLLLTIAKNEEEQFLAVRHLAMFELFYTTGIKPFEAIQMQWQHIQENKLTVLHNNSNRQVELSSDVLQLLHNLARHNAMLVGENQFVWLGLGNKRGEPITEKTVERFFALLTKLVGFKVTATICRYTYMVLADEEKLFDTTGYTRKGNMQERLNKIVRQEEIR